MSSEKQQEIISVYKTIVEEKKDLPIYADFLAKGITKDTIKHNFGGITILHQQMWQHHEEFISRHMFSVEKIFAEEKSAANATKKRFVITTAVAGAKAHTGFLSAIDTYCKKNNAQVVIMPCESITNSFENKTATFDRLFMDKKYLFVQEDTHLNDNISLCSIQVSAKQVKPITGLSRLGKREGSYVFASPKQFLEYMPSGHTNNKNYSIMTPGACTLPNYYGEQYVSKRLSYIAEYDHTIGAIIVEIQDDKIFHFRQIQAAEDGSFIDFGKQYAPDGTITNVPVNVIFGDLHGFRVDWPALKTLLSELKTVSVSNVFLHDVFDGYSISHHVVNITEKAKREQRDAHTLIDELKLTHKVIEYIDTSLMPASVQIVKSNHDEVIDRYVSEGRYIYDPTNHYTALKIATAVFEGEDLLKRAFKVANLPIPSNWKFLSRKDSVQIAGVELAAHGDLGANGARPSVNTFESVYGNCVIGHAHTPAIQRGVFRVGTMSVLDMGYNKGPSSWAHTSCLLYENGQRQLINVVDGSVRA